MRSVDREGTLELGPDCMRDGNETGPLSETAGRKELVRHQKAGASPAEKVARKEIMEQWQREAQAAKAELETVRRQEGDTAERLHQCGEEKQMAERNAERLTMQLDQCNAEKQTVERNIELLTAQFSELRQGRKTADERAAIEEEEVRRLASGLSRQKEEADYSITEPWPCSKRNGRFERSASNSSCRLGNHGKRRAPRGRVAGVQASHAGECPYSREA